MGTKGTYAGGILGPEDVIERCYVNDDGCWIWRGSVDNRVGQPHAWFPHLQTSTCVRRGLFELIFDTKAPRNVSYRALVCGVPLCVNPEHARAITRQRINREAERGPGAKLRAALRARERHAKLTPTQVDEIRSSKEPGTVMAARMGVSTTQISRIRLGKGWQPLGAPVPGSSVFTFAEMAEAA